MGEIKSFQAEYRNGEFFLFINGTSSKTYSDNCISELEPWLDECLDSVE